MFRSGAVASCGGASPLSVSGTSPASANAEPMYWRGEVMRATRHLDTAAFAHQVWPARAGALVRIRREVRRWLGPLEVTPDTEADLVLAVSEAASNVIDHAYLIPTDRAVVEVFFWTESGALLIEVVDHGQWRQPRPARNRARTRDRDDAAPCRRRVDPPRHRYPGAAASPTSQTCADNSARPRPTPAAEPAMTRPTATQPHLGLTDGGRQPARRIRR